MGPILRRVFGFDINSTGFSFMVNSTTKDKTIHMTTR